MVFLFRARDGTRTRGLDLGKVALHQRSHSRISLNARLILLQERCLVNNESEKICFCTGLKTKSDLGMGVGSK